MSDRDDQQHRSRNRGGQGSLASPAFAGPRSGPLGRFAARPGVARLFLALPIAFTLAFSVSVLDIVIWGSVALVMQLVAYVVVWLLLRELPRRIKGGELGAAILLAAIKIAVAAINAAAIAG